MKAFRSVLWSASALFVLGAPLFLDRGALNDLWSLALAVTLASAWNLLGGFAGQISLGYSAFLGIGAYTTVLLSLRGVDPLLTLPLGAIVAAAFSVAIGLPAFRLRGPYFTIATIGVGEAVRVCAASVSFTGGSSGLRMPAGSFDFNRNYFSMVILAILTVALAAYVKRSAFGRALDAIKQDIDAAEALGVNSTRFKLAAHALSAAVVAVAGSLYAINFQYIAPGSVFDFQLSLSIVLMPIIGGVGSVVGPVLGALIVSTLQIKLLSMPALRDSFLFIYGGLLIVLMLYEPNGFVGIGRRVWALFAPAVRSKTGVVDAG
jgi:branched-chain amino acid transport system permease protein